MTAHGADIDLSVSVHFVISQINKFWQIVEFSFYDFKGSVSSFCLNNFGMLISH